MARILATDAAREACTRMKTTVEGGLAESIEKLSTDGNLLSQPNEWDGPRAERFRSDWDQMKQSLLKAKDAVEQLRAQADQITKEIMSAGT